MIFNHPSIRRFRRWLASHISVDTAPIKRPGAMLTFYDDGSAQTECVKGFLLTADQNAALQDFIAEQMGETLEQFERQRLAMRAQAEKVIVMPLAREIH